MVTTHLIVEDTPAGARTTKHSSSLLTVDNSKTNQLKDCNSEEMLMFVVLELGVIIREVRSAGAEQRRSFGGAINPNIHPSNHVLSSLSCCPSHHCPCGPNYVFPPGAWSPSRKALPRPTPGIRVVTLLLITSLEKNYQCMMPCRNLLHTILNVLSPLMGMAKFQVWSVSATTFVKLHCWARCHRRRKSRVRAFSS